ncbi:hypothetical protein PITC_008710 [Penicillium italicum]|uniref:F-box domain-containing protein n=1 Tax=Penicillium italicum TaxID=40296 RepID=A0A0A2L2Q0_PENIT|nr:hypothetical protein PITC_008710 [Penicillium italicum]
MDGSYVLRGTVNSHYFEWIPLEIRLEIAAYLSTVDFLNLRLCSRAVADIFEDQTFWKTRFFVHCERGYLAFLTEGIQRARDWRLIYRCTHNSSKLHPELRIRRRHWQHNRWLRDVYLMTREHNLLLQAQVDNAKSLQWKKAAGQMICHGGLRGVLKGDDCKLCPKCLTRHKVSTQSIPFSRAVVGLAVSVLSDPCSDPDSPHTFVAGLELIYPSDMPNTVLGHRLPSNQIMIDLQARPLKGFEVMIGEGGVRAILPVFNTMNDWVGKPVDEFCGPIRISTDNEILALSVDFDVSPANRRPTRLLVIVILIAMPTELETYRTSDRN